MKNLRHIPETDSSVDDPGEEGQSGCLTAAQLRQAETWLWRQTQESRTNPQRHARLRLWLIFMLLRYGALRLKEILRLEEKDLDFANSQIHLARHGLYGTIPLPPPISRAINKIWLQWDGRLQTRSPLGCDASQVRRSLNACAHALGVGPALINASSLRRQRALELEEAGIHPAIAAYFLGRTRNPAPFTVNQATHILRRHIDQEYAMKTSARNVFRGEIAELEEHGILVTVTIAASDGLRITSIITRTSCRGLRLQKGMAVNALVKAPWVTVLPMGARATAAPENCFEGVVESINRDALACEILVSLPQGGQICALYANGATPSGEVEAQKPVMVCFSPFSVILTAD